MPERFRALNDGRLADLVGVIAYSYGASVGLVTIVLVASAVFPLIAVGLSVIYLGERPVVNQYCIGCHNQILKAGGLMLDRADLSKVPEQADVWEKVERKLRAGLMPPQGMPRPHCRIRTNPEATAGTGPTRTPMGSRAGPRSARWPCAMRVGCRC